MNATVNTHIGRTATVTDEEADSEKHVDMFKVHGRGDVSECPSHSSAIPTERLLPSHPDKASSTSFLSEQDSFVFAAARDRVNLRLRDPSVEIVYGTQANLLKSHKMTVQRPRCIIRETRGGTALARCQQVGNPLSVQHTLCAIWMHYEYTEEFSSRSRTCTAGYAALSGMAPILRERCLAMPSCTGEKIT
ncbi:hypothetical protein LshimejAT787_1901210 [Lyophyllum shimeji]|uniref:Uncharacterized protein n=1 Tax=Lyophyllum shimeji TaxID=47721 RepID=A0A9P3PZW0_LYOSH|nr:hypothetical protein LshimejAT787_1901210 [Lyophyllum shimeji]